MTAIPSDHDSLLKLGDSLRSQRNPELYPAALACYENALKHKPDSHSAHHRTGEIYKLLGKNVEARNSVAKAIELAPDPTFYLLSMLSVLCPNFFDSEKVITQYRSAYTQTLDDVCNTLDLSKPETVKRAAKAVGSYPFQLPYQGFNDRELQMKLGNLTCRIMAKRFPRFSGPCHVNSRFHGEPLRVGIAFGFFHFHSVFRFPVKGWLEALDKRKFALYGYYTGKKQDDLTGLARQSCVRFVENDFSLESLARTILSDKLHVLIYPEIGMNNLTIRLSALRLAPVQCAGWGHSTTSGRPTMDYFLSSDLMEPEDGDLHYSEKLVRLANLSFYHSPVKKAALNFSRSDFGLKENTAVYLCTQNLLKYLPSYDDVLARIAVKTGDCRFVFITRTTAKHLVNRFKDRLSRAFSRHGLDINKHLVFLPWLSGDEYTSLLMLGDVYLDSMEWSGCNTTMDAVEHHLPIVTLPGKLMRGRQTMAILTMMGMTETIADSVEQYIDIASRLGLDRSWRGKVKERMAQSKHNLYRDKACIQDLESFLEKAVSESEKKRGTGA